MISPLLKELDDVVVEGDHPEGLPRLDDLVEGLPLRFAVEDRVLHPEVRAHDLEGRHAVAPLLGKEALADDPADRVGQPDPDLVLLFGREHAEDAVDRLAGIHRVEGAQDQMARLRGGEADLHRLAVPHLADEDHLRRLAERRAQPVREGIEIVPHLPLVEGGLLVGVGEFHRVLEGDDVDRLMLVDLIEERRKRCRFAAPRRAGDEDDPVFLLGHLFEGLGEVQVL